MQSRWVLPVSIATILGGIEGTNAEAQRGTMRFASTFWHASCQYFGSTSKSHSEGGFRYRVCLLCHTGFHWGLELEAFDVTCWVRRFLASLQAVTGSKVQLPAQTSAWCHQAL